MKRLSEYTFQFDDAERLSVAQALRHFAKRQREDADLYARTPGYKRLAEELRAQADRNDALADQIDL